MNMYKILANCTVVILVVLMSTVYSNPIDESKWTTIPLGGKHPPIGPGTDEGMYNMDMFQGDIYIPKSKQIHTRNAVTDPKLLWPAGVVVYKVDENVGCPESPQCNILMNAMAEYHENSCIRFKEWTGEEHAVRIFFNTDSGACWSPVGKNGGPEQRLSLGQRCWYHGIVVHELAHAIGFWHEMNRPDRDDWIYIFWNNILPGFSTAFAKMTPAEVATLGEKFDYKSVMLYDEYAFSKDGKDPTLQAKTGTEIGPIWKKKSMSDSDRRRLLKLYQCDGNRPKNGFPYNVKCTFNANTCGFKNGGSAVWSWRLVNETEGYVYSSFETAGETVGHFVSVNFHQSSNTREQFGCLRFWYLIEADTTASVTVWQAYLDNVTQVEHEFDSTIELWTKTAKMKEWKHAEILIYTTKPFKLIFDSEFDGSNKYGIVALDDIEVLYSECSGEDPTYVPDSKLVHAEDEHVREMEGNEIDHEQ